MWKAFGGHIKSWNVSFRYIKYFEYLDQKYLDCATDDPILELEQQVYLKDGRIFEYSQTRQRYDKGSFLFTNILWVYFKYWTCMNAIRIFIIL